MAAQKGLTLKIKQGDGASPEVFTDIAGIRSKTVTIGGQEIDITTDDDINASGASWRTFLAGINEFSINGSGIAKDKTTLNGMIADRVAGTVRNYQVELTNYGTFEGAMFISSMEFSGEVDGAVTFTITMRNNEAVTYTPV